jgi:hypothetical protein
LGQYEVETYDAEKEYHGHEVLNARCNMKMPRIILLLALLGCCLAPLLQATDETVNSIDDPLQLVPANAIAFLKIDHPHRLVQQAQSHLQHLGVLQFDEVKEVLQATPFQRLQRYLAFAEKQYGRTWQKLLEDLTDQGIVFSIVPGKKEEDKPQFLAIVQARDAKLLKEWFVNFLELIKNETEQSELEKSKTTTFHGSTIHSINPEFHLVQTGPWLLVSNGQDLIQETIARSEKPKASSVLQHSRFVKQERPQDSNLLAWGWLDLEPIKKKAKPEDLEKIKLPAKADDALPHVLFGGLLDTFLRSDHLWLSVTDDGSGPALAIQSPSGRDKSQMGTRVLHMHDPNESGLSPILHPPGTLFSNSIYLDFGALWTHRKEIYREGAIKEFEDADKKAKPFLAGASIGQLLSNIGARHRFIVARQRERAYSIKPKTLLPAFAAVVECRDADQFVKSISLPIRAAGFIASSQVNMKMVNATHAETKILGYRFEEVEKNKRIESGILFNFTPCFCRVGSFVVFSSTQELCQDLIDELKRTKETSDRTDQADARHEFYWSALKEAFAAERPLLATELTLHHGGASATVEEQIDNVLKLLDRLGTIEASVSHSPTFRLELRARYK